MSHDSPPKHSSGRLEGELRDVWDDEERDQQGHQGRSADARSSGHAQWRGGGGWSVAAGFGRGGSTGAIGTVGTPSACELLRLFEEPRRCSSALFLLTSARIASTSRMNALAPARRTRTTGSSVYSHSLLV